MADRVGHDWALLSTQWLRAKVLIDLGDGAGALRTLAHQLGQTSAQDDITGNLASLLVAVGAPTAAGQPREAAILLGMLEIQSRRTGYDPLPMDRLDGEAYVAATRAALDADVFEAAVAEGRADPTGALGLLADLASPSTASKIRS